jgi:hypothetical protein
VHRHLPRLPAGGHFADQLAHPFGPQFLMNFLGNKIKKYDPLYFNLTIFVFNKNNVKILNL